MKAEDVRYLLLTDGKIAFGRVKETEVNGKKLYEVEGALFVRTAETGERFYEGDQQVHNAMQVRNHMQPFSPVGRFIQKSKIPEKNVQMELLDMPPTVTNMLVNTFNAEERNTATRDKLLSMPIPARSNMSPEEALAIVARCIEKNGRLPDTGRAEAHTDNMGTVIGNLAVRKTSPYRSEEQNGSHS